MAREAGTAPMVRACFGCGARGQGRDGRTGNIAHRSHCDRGRPRVLTTGFFQKKDLQVIAMLEASWIGQKDDQEFQGSSRG